MENKYYTPSIEEFYLGFEFEWKRYFEGDVKWKKTEYDPTMFFEYEEDSDVNMNSQVLPFLDKPEHQLINIRVKLLDREDIESLGFKYYRTEVYAFFRKKEYIIQIGPEYTHLSIYDENYPYAEMNGIEDTSIFKGTIKNKSELKVLLKQLGIDE